MGQPFFVSILCIQLPKVATEANQLYCHLERGEKSQFRLSFLLYNFTNFPTLSPIRTKYIPGAKPETSIRIVGAGSKPAQVDDTFCP